jgi:hypothetical protein
VEGIIGLATPIFDATGTVNAAVHISAPRGRLSPDRLPIVLSEMLRTGAAISEQLGAQGTAIAAHSLAEVVELERGRRGEGLGSGTDSDGWADARVRSGLGPGAGPRCATDHQRPRPTQCGHGRDLGGSARGRGRRRGQPGRARVDRHRRRQSILCGRRSDRAGRGYRGRAAPDLRRLSRGRRLRAAGRSRRSTSPQSARD